MSFRLQTTLVVLVLSVLALMIAAAYDELILESPGASIIASHVHIYPATTSQDGMNQLTDRASLNASENFQIYPPPNHAPLPAWRIGQCAANPDRG